MASGTSTAPGPYCELHAHSCFSLLDGVPFPEELAARAAELGLGAVALTDHDALYGLAPFYLHARAAGIKPIVGAELTLEGGEHLTLLAESRAGYSSLCRLITAARAGSPKGEAGLAWEALSRPGPGLICLTGCRRGPVAGRVAARDLPGARRALRRLLEATAFGPQNLYVELQRNLRRDDLRISRALAALAAGHGLKCVATGNAHYLAREDAGLQSALVSIRERIPLPDSLHPPRSTLPWPGQGSRGEHSPFRPNHEYFLRSPAAMYALYPDLPQAVSKTQEVADRCNADLPAGLQVLPAFPTPPGLDAQAYLRQLCRQRLPSLYPRDPAPAAELLEKELAIIAHLGLANYFLVVWDIVEFCRRQGILCHGRGSAANSMAAHLLGISAVDPIAQGLVLERFLSVEHGGTPDIDLDIDAARREEVIQYVYRRWGREHAAMACTYVTYRADSALRDAGFALGFRPSDLPDPSSIPPSSPKWAQVVALAARLQKRPRHLGLHNGGMIVAGAPLAGLIPIEPAAMENRTVVQFDKEWLELLGIVKIDLLGLRMLSAIADTVNMLPHSFPPSLPSSFTDPAVYNRICSARTIGLFQIESGAQVSVIPRLQPRCFQDLVVEVSLIRPGPLQGNMVRPYLRRRQGLEPVVYPHPLLKPALAETLGVIVFQEQVLKIARDVAGFTPGWGELLRRALGHRRAEEEVARFRAEFIAGALTRGLSSETAKQVWGMIYSFAGYSFSKAHAAAFAVIVYWSAWLRVHYPVEYFCGLLRHAPLGAYPAHVLESEARRSGIRFLPFDVNCSGVKATVEGGAIRFGLEFVRGIGEARAEAIVAARGGRPFHSLADFIQRAGLERRPAESLILAGACDCFGERRGLLWELAEAFGLGRRVARAGEAREAALPLEIPGERVTLAPFSAEGRVAHTFAAAGVTAGPHLVELRRDAFARAGCLPLRELRRQRNGATVRVGGLVADGLRRPPTASGVGFIRLDTPEGMVEIIIPPEVYAACREALRMGFLVVEGALQKQPTVLAVVAQRVEAL